MSSSEESGSGMKHEAARKEMDEMLVRRFQRLNPEHPALKVLIKEAKRHWYETLKDSDDD